jgi:hypothetical protein
MLLLYASVSLRLCVEETQLTLATQFSKELTKATEKNAERLPVFGRKERPWTPFESGLRGLPALPGEWRL